MPHYSLLTRELCLTFDCTLVFFIIIIVAIRLTLFNISGCRIMAGSGEPAARGCQVKQKQTQAVFVEALSVGDCCCSLVQFRRSRMKNLALTTNSRSYV